MEREGGGRKRHTVSSELSEKKGSEKETTSLAPFSVEENVSIQKGRLSL